MAFDLPNARECGGTVMALSISRVFRYIEHQQAFCLALGNVFIRCGLSCGGYNTSCPKNIPSQPVIWFWSLVLHVTRNITRQ